METPGWAAWIHGRTTAWVVLAVSVAMTLMAWRVSSQSQANDAQLRFASDVDDAQGRITERMRHYELALQAATGLFAASRQVELDEWRRFTQQLDLSRTYPGIQGLGFAQRLLPASREQALHDLVAQGATAQRLDQVRHGGADDSAIVFLEPLDRRNSRALGFDMHAEPTRRAAMDRARDSGEPALSNAVTLLQEDGEAVQRGTLLYVPVYRPGARVDQPAARRAALLGWVYAPFRMTDLMEGIRPTRGQSLALRLYDGPAAHPDRLLYQVGVPGPAPAFQTRRELTVAGTRWHLEFDSTPAFEEAVDSLQPTLIGLGGLAADILLFLSLKALARNARLAAERNVALSRSQSLLAREQRALAQREQRYRGVLETTRDGFLMAEPHGQIIEVNDAYLVASGRSRQELIGLPIGRLDALMSPEAVSEIGLKVREQGHLRFETRHRHADGGDWPVEVALTRNPQGGEVYAFVRDLTELKRLEAERSAAEAQIRRMAFHDPLTQLPNRRLLLDRLTQALAHARRTRCHGALLYIDLDHFKDLNDTHGHAAGDLLLIGCAQRLQGCTRTEDTVARLGGDEFVMMMSGDLSSEPSEAEQQVRSVATKLLSVLDAPYTLGDVSHRCTPSIGAVLFRDQGQADVVLRQADAAMYEAKHQGRDRLHLAGSAVPPPPAA